MKSTLGFVLTSHINSSTSYYEYTNELIKIQIINLLNIDSNKLDRPDFFKSE